MSKVVRIDTTKQGHLNETIVAIAFNSYLERFPDLLTKQPGCASDWIDFGLMILAVSQAVQTEITTKTLKTRG